MLSGAIASDIISSYCKGRQPEAYPLFPLAQEAQPTDDSIIMLAAAEWLIEDSGHTPEMLSEYIHKWGRKYAGTLCGEKLKQLLYNENIKCDTQSTIPTLCAIPIGIYSKEIDEALELSKISAEATGNTTDCIKDSQATAVAIHLTRKGKSKEDIKAYLEEKFALSTNNTGATAEAIKIFLESNSFEETIRRSISSKHSTTATISGAIASATPGEEYRISKEHERECLAHLPSRMINCICTFNHLLNHPTIETPIRNSYKVDERIYAGEYPATSDEKLGRKEIMRFTRFGITHFINLTESGELSPYTQWLHEGQTHIRFAIKDCGTPNSTDAVAELLKTVTTILKDKKNRIYIHCRGGIGRTGTIVACYYAMLLKEYTLAYNLLERQFSQFPKSAYRNTPETIEQKRFIMQFTDYIKDK